ncbi:OLC1v1003227C1 [Oldenlandia corymbosa var. corymbosa]|uniref:OLC1v1003227C1 n=1 Tax=Oldenlandia corymbosa var. corymbosa TaxID=529605 RepID=A0AAV1DBX9_OLDCO|nr:OLC1v1003227C1 [Oldenlandia corymbosa var. corymbosa]
METLMEEEEYNWREVKLPALIPLVQEPAELERENCERRRGRDILIAVDHGPNSKHAFDWAIAHFCRLADTIHLVHAVSSVQNQIVYEMTQALMEKLSVEAYQVAMVKTFARIVEGDAGKAIVREAERLKPAAVVMGTRGRGIIQRSVLSWFAILLNDVVPRTHFQSAIYARPKMTLLGILTSVLQGSVSEFCFHNCKIAPIIIVPGKGNVSNPSVVVISTRDTIDTLA